MTEEEKKVWRFKTAEECEDGIRRMHWTSSGSMDHLLGKTLPDDMQDREVDDKIHGYEIDSDGWAFRHEDAVYDYPIRS